ncbi:MAG TPA: RdgB/HAM1 family non-canonical purine NTP pyrophosphatase [Burkholderiales bacterium]|nr:RdgB/HAM1 family non-canonical purine NTP pyrophosphatase [Burkholderiales bacterium]
MKRLVLASGNPGKRKEIGALLAPLQIEVVSQSDLAIGEAPEPHPTYLENALAKARHASRMAKLPALADDSGLSVDALGGAPGVDSAVYAGSAGNREERDARNNARLLAELALVHDRSAHYVCVLVLVRDAADPEPLVAQGRWHGSIARAPRGANGFGYDPLFLLTGRDLTAAELDPAEKNRISHRGKALEQLLSLLTERP